MGIVKWALGLDFGDVPAPYPPDTPERCALLAAVATGFAEKMNRHRPGAEEDDMSDAEIQQRQAVAYQQGKKEAAAEIARLRRQLDTAREGYRRDLHFLDTWIDSWVSKMHRDISDEERGQIADDMCCDWINSGTGASIQETLRTLAALDGEDQT